jgi:hypothetical protein
MFGASTILPGTFYAMEPEMAAAMLMVHKHGARLAVEHPELADMYRNVETFFSARIICRDFLPEVAVISEAVAKTAITHAIGLLIPREEREAITRIRRSKQMEERWDFDSAEWREHCRKAAFARHAKGIKVDVQAMLNARGRTAWTVEEKEALFLAVDDLKYRVRTRGPDYRQIAHDLNDRFHEGKPIRYENSCRSLVGYTRKIAKKHSQSG